MIAAKLGLRRNVIDRLKQDYTKTEDCVFNMLVTWRSQQYRDGNLKVRLLDALNQSGRCDLAETLEHTVGSEEIHEG